MPDIQLDPITISRRKPQETGENLLKQALLTTFLKQNPVLSPFANMGEAINSSMNINKQPVRMESNPMEAVPQPVIQPPVVPPQDTAVRPGAFPSIPDEFKKLLISLGPVGLSALAGAMNKRFLPGAAGFSRGYGEGLEARRAEKARLAEKEVDRAEREESEKFKYEIEHAKDIEKERKEAIKENRPKTVIILNKRGDEVKRMEVPHDSQIEWTGKESIDEAGRKILESFGVTSAGQEEVDGDGGEEVPAQSSEKIIVRFKKTGEFGKIPANKFNPDIYEKAQ